MSRNRFYPDFVDEGEMIAGFGQASLIRFLDGKYELRGGSREDLAEAKEWISMCAGCGHKWPG